MILSEPGCDLKKKKQKKTRFSIYLLCFHKSLIRIYPFPYKSINGEISGHIFLSETNSPFDPECKQREVSKVQCNKTKSHARN